MKSYNSFINEKYTCLGNYNENLDGLKFIIIINNNDRKSFIGDDWLIYDSERTLILDEFKKFFDIANHTLLGLKYKTILYVKIYKMENTLKIIFDDPFSTKNTITGDEFLKIGLENLKEHFDIKNKIEKYNL